MATVEQLASRVLRKLGLSPVALADQQTPQATVPLAEVAARALRSLGINPIAEAAATANAGSTSLDAIATRALRRLAVTAGEETPFGADQTLAEEKANAVHETLAAMGYVSWAGDAVPLLAAEQYAVMTAVMLAPSFGVTVDPAQYAGAQEAVRIISLSGANGQALAEAEVRAAHDVLNAQGLATWTAAAIPAAIASQLAVMASVRLAPALGKAASEDAYTGAAATARRMILCGQVGLDMAAEKVRAAHASLDARGLTRWSIFDLPDYVEEPYVLMAAGLMAPEAGMPASAGAGADGERMIRQLIAMPSARRPVKAEYF